MIDPSAAECKKADLLFCFLYIIEVKMEKQMKRQLVRHPTCVDNVCAQTDTRFHVLLELSYQIR